MNQSYRLLQEEAGRCIGCGFCESVCPTQPASGFSEFMGARGRILISRELLRRLESGEDASALARSFYSCLDCYACLQVCPAGVNAGLASHYAKELLSGSSAPPLARMIERMVMKYGSIVPIGRRASRWARGLNIPRRGETLLYTGQMYQLMAYTSRLSALLHARFPGPDALASAVIRVPSLAFISNLFRDRKVASRMDEILRNIALLIKASGTDFFYLYEKEPYPGTLLNDLGFHDSFVSYAGKVVSLFRDVNARRIITVDPHTYDLLKNVVPSVVEGFDFEVLHYLEVIGGVEYKRSNGKFVFHEPCHLSRRFSGFSPAAEALGRAASFVLPEKNGQNTYCCGGPDELLFPRVAASVSERRAEQLAAASDADVVTACPVCLTTLSRRSRAVDISSVLLDSCIAGQER